MKTLLKNFKKISYGELLVFILICILIVYFLITLFDKNTPENFYNYSSSNSGITNVSTTATNGSQHINNNSGSSNINSKTLVIKEYYASESKDNEEDDTPYGEGALKSREDDTPYGEGSLDFREDDTPYGEGSLDFREDDTPYGEGSLDFREDDTPYGEGDTPYGEGAITTLQDILEQTNKNIEDNKDLIQNAYILLDKLEKAKDLAEALFTKSSKRLLEEKRTNKNMNSNYLASLEEDVRNSKNVLDISNEKLVRQQNYISNLKVSGNFDSEFKYLRKAGLIDFDDHIDTNDSNNIRPSTSTSPNKKTIINNNYNQYYGGNKELTKFLKKLIDDKKNYSDMTLMDQGMCSDLNNKLDTMSLAEFKNNRFIQDLKQKCDKNEEECPLWSPSTDQTALIGTLLEKAKDTNVGSMIPKREISNDYL